MNTLTLEQAVKSTEQLNILKLIERIDTFKELDTVGWDSYGAKPIDKQSICNAKMACLLISPASLMHLYPFPALEGQILFEDTSVRDTYFDVECHPKHILVAGANPNDPDADYEIKLPVSPDWHKELDAKVCALFADWIEQTTALKATVFFRPAQWRDWRSAKKHFKRMSGHTLPIEAKVAAVIDGTLIWAESVDEFIKKLKEVIGKKWRGQLHE